MTRRSLHGARAIVTGASSGIGEALAAELSVRGARLLLTARRADRLERLADRLNAAGGDATFLAGDLADAAFRATLISAAADRFQSLDLLVNNAGVGAFGPFAEADERRLRQVMELNFFAPVELIRGTLPLLRGGRRPIVCNVGSVLGHCAVPLKSEYCASKFALHGFSDSLRCELTRENIDVLLVSPSTTSSEFFDQALDAEKYADGGPVVRRRRAMTPAAVARQIAVAIERGRREIILSAGGKLLVAFDRLAPSWMSRLLARFGQSR